MTSLPDQFTGKDDAYLIDHLPQAVDRLTTYTVADPVVALLVRVIQASHYAATPDWEQALLVATSAPEYQQCLDQQLTRLAAAYTVALATDQHTEHQVFGAKRVVELINKKVLSVNSLPQIEGIEVVAKPIFYKIIQLLILAPPDHRLASVVQFIRRHYKPDPELEGEQFEPTRALLDDVLNDKVIQLDALLEFLTRRDALMVLGGSILRLIIGVGAQVWVTNIVELNLMRVAKYYSEVLLDRLRELLGLVDEPIDLERILADMIAHDKFGRPTKLDQNKGTVDFGPVAPATTNSGVAQVVTLVNDISYDVK